MNKLVKQLLAGITCAALLAQTVSVSASVYTVGGATQPEAKGEIPYLLWYDEPAVNSADGWKKQALPVGNGNMGAMMFGMVDTERIQMNEKTLWTGGPGGDYSSTNADAYGNVNVEDPAGTMDNLLDEVFERFYSGNNTTRLPSEYLPNKRYAIGCYQNFAEMYLDFGQGAPQVLNVTSNNHPTNANEQPKAIFDGDKTTKWFTTTNVEFPVCAVAEYDQPVTFDRYTITSGNDVPARDPKAWDLYGSIDGTSFELIDTQDDIAFSGRRQDLTFTLAQPVTYRFIKFEIRINAGDSVSTGCQLSELTLSNGADESSSYTDYQRYLDLRTAKTGVSYKQDGVTYTREMFASYPDNVMVYRMDASEAGALSFTLRPEIPDMTATNTRYNYTGKTGTVNAEGDTITLRGTLKQNGLKFEGQYKVIPTGGRMQAQNDANGDHGSITVTGADSAYVIIALGTDYANAYPDYRGDDPHEGVSERIQNAAALGCDKLLENHEQDYSNLFDRVSLSLTSEYPADKTTDALLADYQKGNHSPYLEQLYYQFGRYMLISSSRETTLPANLQGVWNNSCAPDWQSDYHNNINLQMNYWPAMETNLAETAESLVEYINSLREPGRVTLEKVWGIKSATGEENGWMLNVSSNPFGFTGNVDNQASFTPGAIAFICQNLWDYYQFTQDKDYLASTIYPIMKESCKTYIQTLQPGRTEADKDKLYSAPSYSSEQGPWTVGTIFDQQLIYQLFKDTIAATEELGIDSELSTQLAEMMPKLDPIQIGQSGQIKEWQQEKTYGKWEDGSWIGQDSGHHRHNSQLVALYPGNVITPETEEWMDAAKTTLTLRGDEATGWSMGHKLNLWARTGDGNHAYKLLNNLLSTGTFANLFDYHQPAIFQIDGNFGGTAGITEMLLQSYAGYVELLPALPEAWKEGSYSGLVARGNFEIGVDWSDQMANAVSITSNAGNPLELQYHKLSEAKITRVSDGQPVQFEVIGRDRVKFDTEKGETYRITEIPQDQKRSDAKTFLRSSINNLYSKDILEQTGMTEEDGVFFETVSGGSAAERAGFAPNDVICALNGSAITDTEQFMSVYSAIAEGAAVTAKVWRQTEFVEIAFVKSANDEYILLPGKIQAEDFSERHGSCKTEACEDDGTLNVGSIATGDYLVYKDVSFTEAPTQFSVRTAGKTGSSTVVARLDSLDGPIVATATTGKTGAWNTYETFTTKTENRDLLTGQHDLYICLKAGLNLNWFSFDIDPRDQLRSLTAQAREIDVLDYTGASAAKLAAAIAEADRILDAQEYTEQEVQDAFQTLQEAMALTPRPDRFRYSVSAVRYVNNIQRTGYAQSAGFASLAQKRDELLALLNTDPDDLTESNRRADELIALTVSLALPAQSVKIDDKDESITYGYGEDGPDSTAGNGGAWYNYNGTKYYQGSMTNCKSAWAWAELSFTGNRVTYITEKAQGASLVNVYIDGTLIDTIDTYDSGNGLPQSVVFDTADYPALETGRHTIRVETTDQRNTASPMLIFRVDAFEVFSGEERISDKTALFDALKDAMAIDPAELTEESAQTLRAALAEAVAGAVDPQLSQAETDAALSALDEAVKNLAYNQPPEETDRTILEMVIAKAQALQETDEYANAIPSVRASFAAALDAAVAVGDRATQQQIDDAWISLMREIHKLGFQMGNKKALEALLGQADEIYGNLSLYVDGDEKDGFVRARADAAGVFAHPESMQPEVSEAETTLLNAMIALRFKADKAILEAVLEQANSVDPSGFTPASLAAFLAAKEYALAVLDNLGATQQEVNAAVADLQSAMAKLVSPAPIAGDAALSAANAGSPKTGDRFPVAAVAALAALAAAICLTAGKRKN